MFTEWGIVYILLGMYVLVLFLLLLTQLKLILVGILGAERLGFWEQRDSDSDAKRISICSSFRARIYRISFCS